MIFFEHTDSTDVLSSDNALDFLSIIIDQVYELGFGKAGANTKPPYPPNEFGDKRKFTVMTSLNKKLFSNNFFQFFENICLDLVSYQVFASKFATVAVY